MKTKQTKKKTLMIAAPAFDADDDEEGGDWEGFRRSSPRDRRGRRNPSPRRRRDSTPTHSLARARRVVALVSSSSSPLLWVLTPSTRSTRRCIATPPRIWATDPWDPRYMGPTYQRPRVQRGRVQPRWEKYRRRKGAFRPWAKSRATALAGRTRRIGQWQCGPRGRRAHRSVSQDGILRARIAPGSGVAFWR